MNSKSLFSLLTFTIVILLTPSFVSAEDAQLDNPFGFKFGMSDGDAKKIISRNGNNILKNEVDSKEVRTILFDGAVVDFFSDTPNRKTRLEFYNNKLMSSSVIINSLSGDQFIVTQNEVLKQVVEDFGKPDLKDHLLSYNIWTWYVDNVKLNVSTNRNKGQIKLEYTYMPVADYKAQSELEVKRKGKKDVHPADQMFKDGNYSQQGGPGLGRERYK